MNRTRSLWRTWRRSRSTKAVEETALSRNSGFAPTKGRYYIASHDTSTMGLPQQLATRHLPVLRMRRRRIRARPNQHTRNQAQPRVRENTAVRRAMTTGDGLELIDDLRNHASIRCCRSSRSISLVYSQITTTCNEPQARFAIISPSLSTIMTFGGQPSDVCEVVFLAKEFNYFWGWNSRETDFDRSENILEWLRKKLHRERWQSRRRYKRLGDDSKPR